MPPNARILILGKEGQVARALRESLPAHGVEVSAIGRPEIDLLEPQTAAKAILAAAPSLVILAAAYTAVDRAEDDADAARTINAVAPGAVAEAAAEIGAPIVHFSTDYVFDGKKTSPYLEDDTPAPLGVYGATKLAGEAAVAEANPRHVILRTAWVCSPTGSNFVKTILRLAAERPALRVVADQYGVPTFAADIARAVQLIAARLDADEPLGTRHWGLFHLANEGLTTWHGFASAIVAGAAARGLKPVPVEAIAAADYPARARRPGYSKLSTSKIADVYGVRMPAWQASLETCLDTLLGPPGPAGTGHEAAERPLAPHYRRS
jgi:dTDP-4-dehydrorhamnose reductase